VLFQGQSCAVAVELDVFPDSDALMPQIHLHALACASPSARRAALAEPIAASTPAPASRHLLQVNESNSTAEEPPPAVVLPAVAVADLRRAAATTAFELDNVTVATRLTLALPSYAGPRLLYVPPFACAAMGEAAPCGASVRLARSSACQSRFLLLGFRGLHH
jgi:hypothetical protein